MRAVHTWAQELYEQWEVMASAAAEAGWTPRNRTDAEGCVDRAARLHPPRRPVWLAHSAR
eukprot:6759796-Prymnesium_polylepis.1